MMLEAADLHVHYCRGGQVLCALRGVDLTIRPGESVGLVGESGCGKSTLARTLLRLEQPDQGTIRFENEDVLSLRGPRLKRFRARAQMVFQDPLGSLNPRTPVGHALGEALYVHGRGTRAEREKRVGELLTAVGLEPGMRGRYPHQFSGGQRQRVGIARALALDPVLLIADEPVSSLDVSVQVQILNLLKDLQRDRGLAYLFIAHDLGVVRYMCARVLVMYLGRVVESGPSAQIYRHPGHPYTEALLALVLDVKRDTTSHADAKAPRRRVALKGDVPSPAASISGCPLHPRCAHTQQRCAQEVPVLRSIGHDRQSACHFAEAILLNHK